jgi:hypothetical protein
LVKQLNIKLISVESKKKRFQRKRSTSRVSFRQSSLRPRKQLRVRQRSPVINQRAQQLEAPNLKLKEVLPKLPSKLRSHPKPKLSQIHLN